MATTSVDMISPVLTRDQNRRAAALHEARAVLAARTLTAGAVDAMDVYHLAQFILDGKDPWDFTKSSRTESTEAI